MDTDMRSLKREAKFEKRVKVIELRSAGRSYVQIARQVGLSRTGVFDICKRHNAIGIVALRDAPGGRRKGEGRMLAPEQELRFRQEIMDDTPDDLGMPESLWNRAAVSRLIAQQSGIVLPIRTLAAYLARWGFASPRPLIRSAGPRTLAVTQWLADRYLAVAAKAKAEGGEINWGSHSQLLAEGIGRPQVAAAARADKNRGRNGRGTASILATVTNKGQARWIVLHGTLDADKMVDFLRRLIAGGSKKVFLIMDDPRMRHHLRVQAWLAEHEDSIEAFQPSRLERTRPDST